VFSVSTLKELGKLQVKDFGGAGFSLWGLVRARSRPVATNPHWLKPAPQVFGLLLKGTQGPYEDQAIDGE
jgi:hypothetical protein